MSRFFRSRPVLTNCLVCGTLFSAGDIIAQKLGPDDRYRPDRTIRAGVYGTFFFGVVASTVTYPILNSLAPNMRPLSRLALRICMDQTLLSPFVYIPMYFGTMALFEGASIEQAHDRIQQNWYNTVIVNWRIWVPIQLLNFSVVPPQYRILTVAIGGLAWNTFLALRNATAAHSPSLVPHASNDDATA